MDAKNFTPSDTVYRLASLSKVLVPNSELSTFSDLPKLVRKGRDGYLALTRSGERMLWSAAVTANEKLYGK